MLDLIIKRVTDATTEPVTLAQAKAHLRVDFTDDDDLITSLITAARSHVENLTGRALITQTWRFSLDRFPAITYVGNGPAYQPMTLQYPWWMPGVNAIYLIPCQVQAVTSFQYYDGDGTLQTLGTDKYVVDTDSEPARIVPFPGQIWPAAQYRTNAVQITFTTGYGDDASFVPQPIISAILLTLGDLYAVRESQLDKPLYVNPTVKALLAPYQVYQREIVE